MPEKVTNITASTINTIYVIGGLFTLFSVIGAIVSSYAFFVVKTINEKIKQLRSQGQGAVVRLEKVLDHHRNMHNDHYNRIHDLEKIQAVLKSEHDNCNNKGEKKK